MVPCYLFHCLERGEEREREWGEREREREEGGRKRRREEEEEGGGRIKGGREGERKGCQCCIA